MTRYAVVRDLNYCIGCYNCQIACKDEHVRNDFLPITKSQPTFGHFWIGIKEVEQVISPSRIKVTYIPVSCQHCSEAPCVKAARNGAIYRRPDGIVIIDPVKAIGQKQLVEACPYGSIFWNEEENLPQKCTFCAHLVDDGWTEPRCVQSCPTNCMIFGDLDDPNSKVSKLLAERKGEVRHPEFNTKPNVFYFGLPKSSLSGTIIYGDKNECAGEVPVTLMAQAGGKWETQTDFFGDFVFDRLDAGEYTVGFDAPGYHRQIHEVTVKGDTCYIGEIILRSSK